MSQLEYEYISKMEDVTRFISKINKAFSEGKLPFLDIASDNRSYIFVLVQRPVLTETKRLPDPELEEEEVYHNIAILHYPKRHIRIDLTTGFARVYLNDDAPDAKEINVGKVSNIYKQFIDDIIMKEKDNDLLFLFYASTTNSLYVEYKDKAIIYRFDTDP